MSIYEVVTSYGNKLQELMNLDDIPEQALVDTKEMLMASVAHDGSEHIAVMLNLEADIEAIENAIAKMKSRRDVIKKRHQWLHSELHSAMEKHSIKEISCPEFVAKIKANPASLEITEELDIPPEYFEEIKKVVINNKKVKQDLKDGVNVPGARLVNKTRLEIK